MPVEPGIIDANVLVYALDADAPQHAASRALLEAARDPSTTLYVSSQILCEFYSIVTNARRVPKPRSPADALSAISGLLVFLNVLPVPLHTSRTVARLASSPSCHWWRRIRLTTRCDYAGEWPPENLYVQHRRFRCFFRTFSCDAVTCCAHEVGAWPSLLVSTRFTANQRWIAEP